MYFLDLHIDGFGKFHDLSLSFARGIQVLYGDNEAGKSTIHTFLRAMLFGFTRGRGVLAEEDLMSSFIPWENPSVYGGTLRIVTEEGIWRIERDFYKDKTDFVLANESSGLLSRNPQEDLSRLLGGLTETEFCNTISIGQLQSAAEAGMHEALRQRIANISTSGDMRLNVTSALALLEEDRSRLSLRLAPDASREYASLKTRIRALREELDGPEYRNRIRELSEKEETARTALETDIRDHQALSTRLTEAEKLLREHGFTDLGSVEHCRREADQLYGNYQACRKAAGEKRWIIGAVLSFIIAAALAVSTYLIRYIPGAGDVNTPAILQFGASPAFLILPGLGAALFIVLGMALLSHRRSNIAAERACRMHLHDTLSRFIPVQDPDEDAMKRFHERMDLYASLTGKTAELRTSSEEQQKQMESLRSEQEDVRGEITRQQDIQWTLDRKLQELADLEERAQALGSLLKQNARIHEEIDAIDLAEEKLRELSSSMKQSFGFHLNRAASAHIRGITGGIYDSMDIDDDMNVWLNASGRLVPLRQVSSGTTDQIWLAVRLAAAELVNDAGEPLPLIFDDSFVLYDRNRLHAALRHLAGLSRQVLIFTCRTDEEKILKEEGIASEVLRIDSH